MKGKWRSQTLFRYHITPIDAVQCQAKPAASPQYKRYKHRNETDILVMTSSASANLFCAFLRHRSEKEHHNKSSNGTDGDGVALQMNGRR